MGDLDNLRPRARGIEDRAGIFETKWLFTILYGLFTIWTGLLRGIEVHAYKPKALWFCLVMGVLAILGGFLYRVEQRRAAGIFAFLSASIVLGYYLTTFITNPEEDASIRVGLIIVASIGQLALVFLPPAPQAPRL